jgi:hypothetical protein
MQYLFKAVPLELASFSVQSEEEWVGEQLPNPKTKLCRSIVLT